VARKVVRGWERTSNIDDMMVDVWSAVSVETLQLFEMCCAWIAP
jgi:hypothetical protein